MSKIKTTFIIIFFVSTILYSQQIFFCRGYTERGEPIDQFINNKVIINQTFIILFTFSEKNSEQNIIFLSIDKPGNRFKQNHLSKLLRPARGKQWLVYNHKFTDDGVYTVSFSDFNRRTLATSTITVVNPEEKREAPKPTVDPFPNMKIIFCDNIVNGKPKNLRDKISMQISDGETYIYIINSMPLRSERLMIKVWRKKAPNSDYEEYVDTKKYQVNSFWYDTYFKYRFVRTGQYKINFYNEKEILIKTAYISVEN
ncbi:MAG: hypothetical protein RDU14_17260 [Melioribacteraceae bacterium]|nr:hypothetical protein [Melioribacteraceae bacterium]